MLDNKAKVISVVLTVFIIISLSLAGGLFYLLYNEHGMNLSLRQQLEEVKSKQQDTERNLSDSKKEILALQSALKQTRDNIELITGELEAERKSKEETQANADLLKMELEQQKNMRAELEGKLKDAQKDIKESLVKLGELETKKTELEAKVNDLEIKSKDLETKLQGIELGTIVVSPEASAKKKKAEKAAKKKEAQKAAKQSVKAEPKKEQPAASQEKAVAASRGSGLEGTILVINKDYNFAVINLGSSDGVKVGSVFSVYHNGNLVGDIKVEKVHDSMSAAGLVTPDTKEIISEGDKAVLKK